MYRQAYLQWFPGIRKCGGQYLFYPGGHILLDVIVYLMWWAVAETLDAEARQNSEVLGHIFALTALASRPGIMEELPLTGEPYDGYVIPQLTLPVLAPSWYGQGQTRQRTYIDDEEISMAGVEGPTNSKRARHQ
jgi:hypothetical protein